MYYIGLQDKIYPKNQGGYIRAEYSFTVILSLDFSIFCTILLLIAYNLGLWGLDTEKIR